jgi:sortase B
MNAGEIKTREPETAADEAGAFYNSLAVMTQNDIALNEAAENAKRPPADIARRAVLLILVLVLAYCGYLFVERLFLYVSAAREYDHLRAVFHAGSDAERQDAEILGRTRANNPIQDILSLQRQAGEFVIEAEAVSERIRNVERNRTSIERITDINSDFFGWIKVSHTRIDYPVVQTTNNDYYLNHSFERARNPSGAIFADFMNHRDISRNLNTVIYGHNMHDGSMFQPIIEFGRNREYFNNGIIELITEDAVYYYEIFSARDEDPRSEYWDISFEGDEEWTAFLYRMQERSNFNKNLRFYPEDRIVTLSTCTTDLLRDWRFVVQGILIEIR